MYERGLALMHGSNSLAYGLEDVQDIRLPQGAIDLAHVVHKIVAAEVEQEEGFLLVSLGTNVCYRPQPQHMSIVSQPPHGLHLAGAWDTE